MGNNSINESVSYIEVNIKLVLAAMAMGVRESKVTTLLGIS